LVQAEQVLQQEQMPMATTEVIPFLTQSLPMAVEVALVGLVILEPMDYQVVQVVAVVWEQLQIPQQLAALLHREILVVQLDMEITVALEQEAQDQHILEAVAVVLVQLDKQQLLLLLETVVMD
jgi:hypothetical protein